MKSRAFVLLALAAALVSAPAQAKHKKAPPPPPTPPLPTLSVTVDTDPAHDPANVLYLDLSDGGRVAIRLMPQWAPHHVERIKALAERGFYNGVIFHRVIDGFMAQTGDPTGTGTGGSNLPNLQPEFNSIPHLRGMVSMARTADPASANSQFFIVFYPRMTLDKKYTVFGRVIGGMDWVDKIERGEPPTSPTRVLQASLASDRKPPPAVVPSVPAPAASAAPPAAAPAG